MSNILRAFINIVNNIVNNRANNMGEGLETYIKDVFANTLNEEDTQKKLESKNSAITLNSSYPKAKLYANNPMITTDCRACEERGITLSVIFKKAKNSLSPCA